MRAYEQLTFFFKSAEYYIRKHNFVFMKISRINTSLNSSWTKFGLGNPFFSAAADRAYRSLPSAPLRFSVNLCVITLATCSSKTQSCPFEKGSHEAGTWNLRPTLSVIILFSLGRSVYDPYWSVYDRLGRSSVSHSWNLSSKTQFGFFEKVSHHKSLKRIA